MTTKKKSGKGKLSAFCSEHPVIFHLLLICASAVLLSLLAHVAMQVGTRHNSRRTVPDFTGVPLDEARRTAAAESLELIINDSLFVPAYDGGTVLDQLPKGGTGVKPGRKVYITINSYRQKSVEVPYVAGRSLRQAKNMLEIAGLEIAELIYRPDMATNYVLEQWCNGRRMERDERIEMEMGSGVTLCVGAEDESETVVPKVIGLSASDAKGRLWESGLNVGTVKYAAGIDRLTRSEALVCVQSVTAGMRRSLGTRVDIELTLDTVRVASAGRAADEELARIIASRSEHDDDEVQEGIDTLLLREIL